MKRIEASATTSERRDERIDKVIGKYWSVLYNGDSPFFLTSTGTRPTVEQTSHYGVVRIVRRNKSRRSCGAAGASSRCATRWRTNDRY
jgi:hypothetical protein